jgi:predicted RNA-binding protein with RPS1 domain
MAKNTFLTAKRMAQELVRARIKPAQLEEFVEYMHDNKDDGAEALLAHVQEQDEEQAPAPLQEALESQAKELDDVDELIDVLGWGVGFMKYYRGEGNRPLPKRRPSEPRKQPKRRPRRSRSRPPEEVKFPMESLQEGQKLEGVVRRIMPYGAFVSVGAERDGLVHVSEMSQGFTEDPSAVVDVDDKVDVWVKNVDMDRKRISLTMKGAEAAVAEEEPRRQRPRRRRGRRRDNRPRRPSGSRVFEDEAPKEMTALAEALREALAEKEAEEQPQDKGRRDKQDGNSEDLTDVYRRTLYGQ